MASSKGLHFEREVLASDMIPCYVVLERLDDPVSLYCANDVDSQDGRRAVDAVIFNIPPHVKANCDDSAVGYWEGELPFFDYRDVIPPLGCAEAVASCSYSLSCNSTEMPPIESIIHYCNNKRSTENNCNFRYSCGDKSSTVTHTTDSLDDAHEFELIDTSSDVLEVEPLLKSIPETGLPNEYNYCGAFFYLGLESY